MQCASSSSFKPRVEGLEDRTLMAAHLTATLSNGLLRIDGTDGPDHIVVRQQNHRISIDNLSINVAGHGRASSVSDASVKRIEIHSFGGDDWIEVGGSDTSGANALLEPTTIWAGTGNDRVWGSQGNDEIHGEAGNDQLVGRGGNDRIYAGAGNDWLDGGTGTNYLSGQGGNDTINSRSSHDKIDGGSGYDTVNYSTATAPRSSSVNVEVFKHSSSASLQSPFAADVSQLIDLINRYRIGKGLGALKIDSRLTAAANYQANYMARTGAYAHDNLDGRTIVDRVHAAGYSFSFIAENIHVYDPTNRRTVGIDRYYSLDQLAQYYFDGWRVSPEHKANMLLPQVINIGVGIARASNGRIYVSAVFGRP